MAVHMATSFVMAIELQQPDASAAIAVSRHGCEGALQLITRSPLKFSDAVPLDAAQIGDEIPAMLPGKIEAVTPEQIAEVDQLIRHNEGLRLESL
jgi:hypothetical protein